jgi:hypothetical protein
LKTKKKSEPKESSAATKSTMAPTNDETKPSSPQANSQAENPSERSVLGSDSCPQGQKAAERKRNDGILFEKVFKAQEELVRISKKQLITVKSAMQTTKDHHIMAMDISGLDEESQAYWQRMKHAILDCPDPSTSTSN